VPHQNSSGGKTRLLGISKRGNVYLRTLLIHGGRALVQLAQTRADRADTWLAKLVGPSTSQHRRRGDGQQECALAWALLSTGKAYEPMRATTAAAT
jgi:transposase